MGFLQFLVVTLLVLVEEGLAKDDDKKHCSTASYGKKDPDNGFTILMDSVDIKDEPHHDSWNVTLPHFASSCRGGHITGAAITVCSPVAKRDIQLTDKKTAKITKLSQQDNQGATLLGNVCCVTPLGGSQPPVIHADSSEKLTVTPNHKKSNSRYGR